MLLQNLKSPDIEKLDKDGIIVVIPLGSIEAHGPHLPIGADSIIAEHFAKKVCSELDNTIVAPTIQYAFNLINYDYSGTVSVHPEHYADFLHDIVVSLHHHGFSRFVLFSGHGGNDLPAKLAIIRILNSNPIIKMAYKTWWQLAKVRSKHAEKIETELIMMIAPELVENEKAIDCKPENPWHWFASRKKYYPDTFGVNGEPTKANMKDSEILYKRVTDGLREFLMEIA